MRMVRLRSTPCDRGSEELHAWSVRLEKHANPKSQTEGEALGEHRRRLPAPSRYTKKGTAEAVPLAFQSVLVYAARQRLGEVMQQYFRRATPRRTVPVTRGGLVPQGSFIVVVNFAISTAI
jgi:hypothetical protein